MDNVVRGSLLEESAPSSDFSAADGASGDRAVGRDRPVNFPRRVKLSPQFMTGSIAATDLILVLMTASGVFAAYFRLSGHSAPQPQSYIATAMIAAGAFVALFQQLGGYRPRRLQTLSWQISRIAPVWCIAVAFLLLVAFAGKISEDYSRGWALGWFFTTPAVLIAGRGIARCAVARWLRDGSLARNIVIVGAGGEGQKLVAKLQRCRDESILISGIFDDRPSLRPETIHGVPVLGTTDDLLRCARQQKIDDVIVALPLEPEDRLKAVLEKLTVIPADLRLSIDMIAERFPARGVGSIADVPMLEIADRPFKHGRALCKWLEDKLLGGLVLVFVGPLLLLIALLIKLDSRGPVLFVQERFGFNNNVIRVLKFRTMHVDREDQTGAQRTVENDPRVTRIGRVLRSLSLDELPQLLNVLRGDMSVVGPRPHAIAMKAGDRLYHHAVAQYPHRHRVKPGITGWAQVNGLRGEVDTLEKARGRVELDLYYIAHWSVLLDFKILLMTVRVLLSRTDAY